MPLAPDYNDAVRGRFGDPAHAGGLPEAAATYDHVLEAEQASGDSFAHLVLTAGVRGDTIGPIPNTPKQLLTGVFGSNERQAKVILDAASPEVRR